MTDDDEATEDLNTERVQRTPSRVRTRRSRVPSRRRTRRPTRRPTARPTRRPTRTPTRRPIRRCPTVTFPCARMPSVCANMLNAIRSGKPSQLTRITNSAQIARNRRDSGCRSLGSRPGHNCDEYPFASSAQGGRGAVVRLVPIRENSIQGGTLAAFYRRYNIGNNDCFNVRMSSVG